MLDLIRAPLLLLLLVLSCLCTPILSARLSSLSLGLPLLAQSVSAYVPAVPVDDTSALNLTDDSRLNLKWNPDAGSGGVYGASVSYQLEADEPTPGSDRVSLAWPSCFWVPADSLLVRSGLVWSGLMATGSSRPLYGRGSRG